MALASERIPNRMSTSRCVMMTLHLGRDDQGKENAVSPLPYGVLIRTRDWHFATSLVRVTKDTMFLGCVALVHPTLLMFIKY